MLPYASSLLSFRGSVDGTNTDSSACFVALYFSIMANNHVAAAGQWRLPVTNLQPQQAQPMLSSASAARAGLSCYNKIM